MRNKELIDVLKGNETLLDGSLQSLSIYYDENSGALNIVVKVKFIRKSKYKGVLLKFSITDEYSFNWSKEYNFYYIERYKFFMTENNLIYLCLDPYQEVNFVEKEDNDFILSKEVVGEFLEN